MKFRPLFYGGEARVLGMMYRRNAIYFSILKRIAKDMGGHVPNQYRGLVIQHASDAADMVIRNESDKNNLPSDTV